MAQAKENILKAMERAFAIRPKVGGFPVLAEVLRQAGVKKNIWSLPSCQSVYVTDLGNVVSQGEPLLKGLSEVPDFNREALVRALRVDQAGASTFPEFLQSTWEAGVVSYIVDFEKRQVIYYGVSNEFYAEDYPAVKLD